MPRVCTVCTHAERPAIDAAIVRGDANRRIATHYSLSEAAVRRHASDHLPATVVQAKAVAAVAQADDLLAQLRGLRSKAVSLLMKAETAGDYRTALAGIREARATIELLLEVEGELDRRGTVNIVVTPAWVEVRTAVLKALEPYPAAQQAIVSAFRKAETHVA